MKNAIVIIKTFVLLIVSTSAMANLTSVLEVTTNSNSIMISLNTLSSQPLKISILKIDGQVLYSEQAPKHVIESKQYDVSVLPSAEYLVEVIQGNTTRIQPFYKNTDNIVVDQSKVLTYFAPIYKKKMDHVDVNLLCSIDFASTIRIIDDEGYELYVEKLPAGGKIEKRFDLSNLQEGAYTFLFEVSSPVYEKQLFETFEISTMHASL